MEESVAIKITKHTRLDRILPIRQPRGPDKSGSRGFNNRNESSDDNNTSIIGNEKELNQNSEWNVVGKDGRKVLYSQTQWKPAERQIQARKELGKSDRKEWETTSPGRNLQAPKAMKFKNGATDDEAMPEWIDYIPSNQNNNNVDLTLDMGSNLEQWKAEMRASETKTEKEVVEENKVDVHGMTPPESNRTDQDDNSKTFNTQSLDHVSTRLQNLFIYTDSANIRQSVPETIRTSIPPPPNTANIRQSVPEAIRISIPPPPSTANMRQSVPEAIRSSLPPPPNTANIMQSGPEAIRSSIPPPPKSANSISVKDLFAHAQGLGSGLSTPVYPIVPEISHSLTEDEVLARLAKGQRDNRQANLMLKHVASNIRFPMDGPISAPPTQLNFNSDFSNNSFSLMSSIHRNLSTVDVCKQEQQQHQHQQQHNQQQYRQHQQEQLQHNQRQLHHHHEQQQHNQPHLHHHEQQQHNQPQLHHHEQQQHNQPQLHHHEQQQHNQPQLHHHEQQQHNQQQLHHHEQQQHNQQQLHHQQQHNQQEHHHHQKQHNQQQHVMSQIDERERGILLHSSELLSHIDLDRARLEGGFASAAWKQPKQDEFQKSIAPFRNQGLLNSRSNTNHSSYSGSQMNEQVLRLFEMHRGQTSKSTELMRIMGGEPASNHMGGDPRTYVQNQGGGNLQFDQGQRLDLSSSHPSTPLPTSGLPPMILNGQQYPARPSMHPSYMDVPSSQSHSHPHQGSGGPFGSSEMRSPNPGVLLSPHCGPSFPFSHSGSAPPAGTPTFPGVGPLLSPQPHGNLRPFHSPMQDLPPYMNFRPMNEQTTFMGPPPSQPSPSVRQPTSFLVNDSYPNGHN